MDYIAYLTSLGSCQKAIDVAKGKTAQEAWDTCKRGDWMLWLIQRTMPDTELALRKLTLVKARCAKLVVHLMKDTRSINALEVAEQFGLGNATREELDAASASAAYAASASAASAAYASANAAYASAASAADAADAAAYAAYASANAANAARDKILKQCAKITRAEYPVSPATDF